MKSIIPLYQIEDASVNEIVVGIDLGTTNSLIAYAGTAVSKLMIDSIKIVECEQGSIKSYKVPSVVYYHKNGEKCVGYEALSFSSYIANTKRFMGVSIDDIQSDGEMQSGEEFGFDIDFDISGNTVFCKTESGKLVSVIDVASDVLSFLKKCAETELKQVITKAVITVPAYFTENARFATIKAANKIGLEVIRLLNEPTAAAIAYGLSNEIDGISLFYDLGGGTFDVSILEIKNGLFKVLSTCGDTVLGGNDFDLALLKLLCYKKYVGSRNAKNGLNSKNDIYDINTIFTISDIEIDKINEVDLRKIYKTNLELHVAVNFAKSLREEVSNNPDTDWVGVFDGMRMSISQLELDLCFANLGKVTIDIVKEAIKLTELSVSDISKVFLIGGVTRMPFIKKILRDFFAFDPICTIDPDKVVAIGAAMQAYAITQQTDHLVIDVSPISIGIEIYGGGVEVMIPRNSFIPISATKVFTTSHDDQTGIVINVVQGEKDRIDECYSLSKFTLIDIPRLPAGKVRIEVTFSLDVSGILTVMAVEVSSGVKHVVEVSAIRDAV